MIFFLIFISILFIPLAGLSFIYLLIGIAQLVTGYKENNNVKKKTGWITVFITGVVLFVTVYYYLSIIFSFSE